MSASNENNLSALALVPPVGAASPPLEMDAIGTDLIDEVTLAVRLGVSRSTLQSWRYSGRGPRWVKLGRLVRYRRSDIDDYLQAQLRGRMA